MRKPKDNKLKVLVNVKNCLQTGLAERKNLQGKIDATYMFVGRWDYSLWITK